MSIGRKLQLALGAMIAIPILVVFMAGSASSGMRSALALISLQSAAYLLCASAISALVSKTILKPLQELHKAAERIMAGDLDFEIGWKSDDEIGRYCQAFERMRLQLSQTLERKEALEKSRKELIASISHDLRTPMSSIKGYVEGLSEVAMSDKKKLDRYLAVIKAKTESLDNLIESLFQYAQMDMGEERESMTAWDSRELLEKIVSQFEMEFEDQQATLEVTRPFPSALILASDRSIAQVFANLVSNARRHIPSDGKISIAATLDKEGSIAISIADNGSGISKEDLPHVFEQFYRAEKSRSRSYGGAGLGLAICKKIVESHGGSIWAESEPGVKTAFWFKVPVEIKSDSSKGG